MKRLLTLAAPVALGVTLISCGNTSRPQVDPDLAGQPTWAGCHSRSVENIDYVSDALGKPTALAALAPYRTPGDHVVRRANRSAGIADWLLVDDHGVIHTSLELEHGRHGYLIGMVERCAPGNGR